jgi:hypothetical protein
VESLNAEVLSAAVTVQRLERRRSNLLEVLSRLALLENVSQNQLALSLLLPQADFGGALDVLDDLRTTVNSDQLAGLQCFRCVCPDEESKCMLVRASG